MALNVKELIALADHLDKAGQHDEASKLDEMVQKLAAMEDTDPEEAKKEFDGFVEEVGGMEKFLGQMKDGPQIYSRNPETNELEVQQETEQQAPEEAQSGSQLDPGLERSLAKLSTEGWNIFGPGDLEKWLDIKGYKKMQDMPEEEVAKIQEELDKEDDDDDMNLPPYLPGAFDLNSPNRIQPEEVKKELDLFLSDPNEAAGESLTSKIKQLIDEQKGDETVERSVVTDEEAASEIEKAEREKGVVWSSKEELFKKLASLADRLDKIGAVEEATLVDQFIEKHATDLEYQGEGDTEQSKRYDDKYHHSLQVREPKTKQERVDREGREKHHVHTYENQERETIHYNRGDKQKKEASLSTRYCPEHVGVSMGRVGDNTFQCPLCREVYNWETGWTDQDGKEHPGGSVAAQTPDSSGYDIPHRIFDSRENISNRVT